MRDRFENIPGAETLSSVADGVFPVSEEHASLYHGLSGLWIAGGAFASEQVVEWIEKANSAPSTAALVGTLAVAAVPAGASAFFWRRGWQSRGE